MHARCQNAGRRIRDFKFMIGKGMQRCLVDKAQRMPSDHRQHTRTAPTCWRRLPCEPMLARLLGTRNPELLHAELKGRPFQSEPCGCAGRQCTKSCCIVRRYASQGVSLIGRPRLPRVGVNSTLTERPKVGPDLWCWWPHRRNLGRS